MGTHKHTDSFRTHTDITCAHIFTYGFLSVLQKKKEENIMYIYYTYCFLIQQYLWKTL